MTQDGTVWGLVSDIHGNLVALEAALRVLGSRGATRLAFLGDYLGRGEPDRCVERIREVADLAIVGNRDLDWQDRVSPATKAWVLGLPRTAHAGALLLSHGDARLTPSLSTAQINRDFTRAWREMETLNASVWAFGHSHNARTWVKCSPTQPPQQVRGDAVDMHVSCRYFLNVGTTGLPFPGKGGPSVAVVDFPSAQLSHVSLESTST